MLIGRGLLTAITCGLGYAWLRAKLTQYLISRTSFGGVRGRFVLEGKHFQPTFILAGLFAYLVGAMPNSAGFTLEFRNAPVLGPNALTFPGGRIIVTDQLLKALPEDDEALAVIAHELGHAHYRHVLREAVRSASAAVLGGALLGDASSNGGRTEHGDGALEHALFA